MELKDLLASPVVLPSIPKVIALLLNELARDEADLMKISQLISTDPALTSRLLQTANAPFFRLSGKITSTAEGLAILGLPHIQAMATQAASAASMKAVPGIQLQQFWAYSLSTAKIARSLAGRVRLHQGAAFTCGLIHAVGELIMHTAMPEAAAALDNEMSPLDVKRARLESKRLGYNYAHVTGAFARQWSLPQPVVDALAHQDAPFEHDVYEPLAGVIHLATWRARTALANRNEHSMAVTFPSVVGEALGLDMDMVLQQDAYHWFAQR